MHHLACNRRGVNMSVCSLCQKTFSWDVDLKRHMLTIHGGILFKCPTCERTFNRKDSYNRHMKTRHARPEMDIREPILIQLEVHNQIDITISEK